MRWKPQHFIVWPAGAAKSGCKKTLKMSRLSAKKAAQNSFWYNLVNVLLLAKISQEFLGTLLCNMNAQE